MYQASIARVAYVGMLLKYAKYVLYLNDHQAVWLGHQAQMSMQTAMNGRDMPYVLISTKHEVCYSDHFVSPLFQHILPQQQLLEDPDMMQRLLRYIPDDELVEQLKRSWSVASSRDAGHGSDPSVSVRRWDELVQEVEGKVRKCDVW